MSSNTIDIKNGEIARDVTDEEVAFYEAHGWVKLSKFIAPSVAADLLEAGKKIKDAVINGPATEDPKETKLGVVHTQRIADWAGVWVDRPSGARHFEARKIRVDPFWSFLFNKSLGRALQRLMNRSSLTNEEVGVRYLEDALWCKDSPGPGSGDGTPYHQDGFDGLTLDRVGAFNLWVALDEVTPEQGAMRFLDKSHHAGLLGGSTDEVLKRYPKLTEKYEWAPPLYYKPGDATIHHGLMVHGSPENATTKPRWSYIPTFMPADCVVTNEKAPLGYPEPFERFPQVYP